MARSAHFTHLGTTAWAILLALLLLLPAEAYDPAGRGWLDRLLDSAPLIDKAVHAALFAVLALLLRRSLVTAGVDSATRWTVAVSVGYGVLLEVLQTPIPSRSAGLLDMIANTVGAVGGAIMATSPDRSPKEGGRASLATRDAAEDPEP